MCCLMMAKPTSIPNIRLPSGWRNAGVINTTLICALSIILITLLFISAFRLGSGWPSIFDSVLYFSGYCPTANRKNIIFHLGLNALATLVLASSNFFMQILCSPTREDIDKAHRRARFLEIGVQSVRNLPFIPVPKLLFWLLLCASSVPLHLFFNGVVTESRASTNFLLIIASDSFLGGGNWSYPATADDYFHQLNTDVPFGLRTTDFLSEVAFNSSTWEKRNLSSCLSVYDDPRKALITYRHVVMIAHDEGDAETTGWNASEIRVDSHQWKNSDVIWPPHSLNPLWSIELFERTDQSVGERHKERSARGAEDFEIWDSWNWVHNRTRLDPDTSLITPDPLRIKDGQPRLKVEYCLMEPFIAPCEVQVQNAALLFVCIFCLVKSLICIVTLTSFWRQEPLVTPGDAIASFIKEPDRNTENMCWASKRPLSSKTLLDERRIWVRGPRQWKSERRRLGTAVPWGIWAFSYFCICFMLGVALQQTLVAWSYQPW